jgi:hypothetical protein
MARLTEIHHQHRAGWIPPYSIARPIVAAGSAAGEGRGGEKREGAEETGMGGVDGNGTGWAVDGGKWEEKMEKEGEIER